MVTIIDYHVRTSSKDGREFIALELQAVQSEQTRDAADFTLKMNRN